MDVAQLRELLSRLYSPETSQNDRAAISQELTRFSSSPNSWDVAFRALSSAGVDGLDENTAFILLGVLEQTTKSLTKWRGIPPNNRIEIREYLVSLTRQAQNTPFRRKAEQVLVLIGQQECLTYWPDFAQFVCMECEQGRPGLMLAACEIFSAELSSTTAVVSQPGSRQAEYRAYITNIAGPLFATAMIPRLAVDPMITKSAVALVEWVPLNRLEPAFIQALFSACDQPLTASTALMALTQLLERSYLPANLEGFIGAVSKRAFDSLASATPENLSRDPDLCNAILCFIAAFAKRHLSKADAFFSMTRFLEMFFEFTLVLGDMRYFLQALEVWRAFIETCSEFEEQRGMAHPYAATVMSPLLYRMVERFLFCKSAPGNDALVGFLERLEESTEFLDDTSDEDDGHARSFSKEKISISGNEEDDGPVERDEDDCDLSFLIGKVVSLCQRTAMLPMSAPQAVSTVLESAYSSIQSEGGKLRDPNAVTSRRAARDLNTLLRVVSATSILFGRPDFCKIPAVTNLALWSLELLRLCLQDQVWGRGPAFVALFSQAVHSCVAFLAWAQQAENSSFIQESTKAGLETLTKPGCPEGPRRKAIWLLQSVPSELWLTSIDSLHQTTMDMNDYLRGQTYALFSLATWKDPQRYINGLHADLEILSLPIDARSSHRIKVSLKALQAIVLSTNRRPESAYKQMVFGSIGQVLIQNCLRILALNGTPGISPSITKLALDVLDAVMAHLRRQLGDEQCFLCVSTCLESSVALDVKLQEKVLMLVDRVVQENSRAFDKLLPNVLTLIAQIPKTNTEFTEMIETILSHMFIGHFSWLSQDPERFMFVATRLGELVDMTTPPDLVRKVCRDLSDVNTKHLAFKSNPFKTHGITVQIFNRVVVLLASGEREMVADELIQLAYACASADWEFFRTTVLPASSAMLSSGNSSFIHEACGKDVISFSEALITFAASTATS